MANPNDPAPGPTVVTPASGAAPTHPAAGESPKVPEMLAGKMSQEEFASLPESARTILVDRAKQLQADYTKKTTDLAVSRKQVEGLQALQDQLDADPKLAKHLDQAMADYKAGKLSKAELTDEWEQLKEEADESGRKVLAAIEKKFSASEIVGKLEKLEGMLTQVVSTSQTSRKRQLDAELAQLPAAFKPLAEEQKDKLVRLGLTPTFAQDSVRDLLMRVAPREAYEAAYFQHRQTEAEHETQRVQELAGFPSVAGAPETPVLQEGERVKSRDPRFGDGIRFSSVITRLVNEAKRHLPGLS